MEYVSQRIPGSTGPDPKENTDKMKVVVPQNQLDPILIPFQKPKGLEGCRSPINNITDQPEAVLAGAHATACQESLKLRKAPLNISYGIRGNDTPLRWLACR